MKKLTLKEKNKIFLLFKKVSFAFIILMIIFINLTRLEKIINTFREKKLLKEEDFSEGFDLELEYNEKRKFLNNKEEKLKDKSFIKENSILIIEESKNRRVKREFTHRSFSKLNWISLDGKELINVEIDKYNRLERVYLHNNLLTSLNIKNLNPLILTELNISKNYDLKINIEVFEKFINLKKLYINDTKLFGSLKYLNNLLKLKWLKVHNTNIDPYFELLPDDLNIFVDVSFSRDNLESFFISSVIEKIKFNISLVQYSSSSLLSEKDLYNRKFFSNHIKVSKWKINNNKLVNNSKYLIKNEKNISNIKSKVDFLEDYQKLYYQSLISMKKKIILFENYSYLIKFSSLKNEEFYKENLLGLVDKDDIISIYNKREGVFEEFNVMVINEFDN
ncbi:MAG: hypothetical protein AD073_000001 [Mycoplasmataceae bacterium]|nr:MAG: hypothetical protein AD073_000001 [Mycoplasmataceae bacterium]